MARSIQAPGIELREFDRSGYNNKQNYSIVGTTVFINGFADQGEDYTTQWINTKKNFINTYGYPTNEPETYFYNAAVEVLNKGGVLMASKMPYYNDSHNKFNKVTYKVSNIITADNQYSEFDTPVISFMSALDPTLTSYIKIENSTQKDTCKITLDDLDQLKTKSKASSKNTITIVDISRTKYGSLTNGHCVSSIIHEDIFETNSLSAISETNDCLGLVPVIVPAVNALYLQNKWDESILSLNLSFSNFACTNSLGLVYDKKVNFDYTPPVTPDEEPFDPTKITVGVNLSDLTYNLELSNTSLSNATTIEELSCYAFELSNTVISINIENMIQEYSNKIELNMSNKYNSTISVDYNYIQDHMSLPLAPLDGSDDSISKDSTELFPTIQFLGENVLDNTYMKSVAVIVYKAIQNESDSTKIELQYLEHFIGSLDKTAKDPVTKASTYIDNVVNNNSVYINLFSNIDYSRLHSTKAVFAKNLTSYSLGFYNLDQLKIIDYKNSIINGLNVIFERNKDPNLTQIDLVVDAGMSNIAQTLMNARGILNGIQHQYIRDFTYRTQVSNENYPTYLTSSSDTKLWYNVVKKYDEFCKYSRKDCMFIADGLKTLCLTGDVKIVRTTDLESSIQKNILPKIRYMPTLNSSYTAGYCNWFKILDDYTGDLFWCPPSIKVAGIYLYIDTYYKTWDAPAGMTRGSIDGAVDCAFTPTNYEAGILYNQCWNYAINYPLQGIVLEGQKTMQLQKTAFDRINVRRLFLYLEKRVVQLAKYILYEANTPNTRQKFVDLIKPIFESAVQGYGIKEYYIKCDSTNNTPSTIDNNEFHCEIAIKPIKTIEFIVLDFVCTNQSANVTEQTLQ